MLLAPLEMSVVYRAVIFTLVAVLKRSFSLPEYLLKLISKLLL